MIKKLISIVIVICLLGAVNGYGYATSIKEPIKASPGEFDETFSTTPAITQNDVNNNYENYASKDSTYYFQHDARSENYTEINHVGAVLDIENDSPIPNATIGINSEVTIKTDNNGRFQVPDFPAGKYNFTISADGYKDSHYLNVEINNVGSTVVSIMYMSKINEYIEDHDRVIKETEIIEQDAYISEINQIAPAALSAVPQIKKTIKVQMADGTIKNMQRADYLYGAVFAEAVSLWDCRNNNMTDTQIWQYYCAMAELTNTFAVYFQKVETSKHSNCDICTTTHCQSYKSAGIPVEIIEAVDDIFYSNSDGSKSAVVLMHKPTVTTYNYICAYHFASCNGNGTITVSNLPYLRGKSCTDLVTVTDGGHRMGLCQSGAAMLAKNGTRCESILTYYFTDSDSEFCKMVS